MNPIREERSWHLVQALCLHYRRVRKNDPAEAAATATALRKIARSLDLEDFDKAEISWSGASAIALVDGYRGDTAIIVSTSGKLMILNGEEWLREVEGLARQSEWDSDNKNGESEEESEKAAKRLYCSLKELCKA